MAILAKNSISLGNEHHSIAVLTITVEMRQSAVDPGGSVLLLGLASFWELNR